jgi:hypothetical protein
VRTEVVDQRVVVETNEHRFEPAALEKKGRTRRWARPVVIRIRAPAASERVAVW